MSATRYGSYNTSTVFWSTREASTINPVIVDLLFIHALHSIHFSLNPYIFYHPVHDNFMADDSSCIFDLSDTSFLSHMSSAYPQPLSPWQIHPLPP